MIDLSQQNYSLEKKVTQLQQEVDCLKQHIDHYKKKAQDWKTSSLVHQKRKEELKEELDRLRSFKSSCSSNVLAEQKVQNLAPPREEANVMAESNMKPSDVKRTQTPTRVSSFCSLYALVLKSLVNEVLKIFQSSKFVIAIQNMYFFRVKRTPLPNP